jgi:hypothetical protein
MVPPRDDMGDERNLGGQSPDPWQIAVPESRWPAALLVVAAIAGLVAYLLLRDVAFPTASVKFKIDRATAVDKARTFWAARGVDLQGYWQVITFSLDGSAKDYIDQKAGLATLNRLAQREISVWQWQVRFFKPLQQEEFETTFDVNGRIVGFNHVVPEAARGAELSEEEARQTAVLYLRQGQGTDLDDYTLLESSRAARPNRVDYSFTWERRDFKIADGTYRLTVVVRGDEVAYYHEGLKIPEEWFNDQRRVGERSNLLGTVGSFLDFILFAALAIAFLLEMRARRLRWRFAILVAAVVVVVVTAAGLNDLPLRIADYDTTKSMAAYLLEIFIPGLFGVVGAAIYIAWQGTTGEALWRRMWPERISPTGLTTRQGLRSRSYVAAILVGYALGIFWMGYALTFYRAGQDYFAVWVPVDVPYDDILSTWLPWLYPMTVGAWAAINEETFYRLFSISLLRRYLRFPWLAALIPGVIWASLHAWYPQQPFFIRVLELSVVGLVLGLAFLRYGVLATITAHYLYNAAVTGPVIWEAGTGAARAGLIFVLALPALTLLPAVWDRLHGRRLLLPADFPAEPEPAAPPVAGTCRAGTGMAGELEVRYAPVHRLPARVLAIVVVAAAFALAFLIAVTPPHLGSFLNVAIGRDQAVKAARDELERLGFSPVPASPRPAWRSRGGQVQALDEYRVSVEFAPLVGGDDTAYLARELGVARADRFLGERLPTFAWHVRWWRPEQEERFEVWIDPAGRPVRMDHTLEEKAGGGKGGVTAARTLAERTLVEELGVALDRVNLVNTSSEERPARTDYTFTWERKEQKVGEGALRHYVTVKGGTVGAYGTYFKVPEAYIRQRAETTAWRVISEAGRDYLPSAAALVVLVIFILRFRAGRINLRLACTLGGIMAGVGLVGWLNESPLFFFDYRYTESLTSYVVRRVVMEPEAMAWAFASWAMIGGVVAALYREAFPGEMPLEQQLVRWRERLSADGVRGTRVALLALAACPLYYGALALAGWAWVLWLPEEAGGPEAPYHLLNPALHVLAALTQSIESTMFYGTGLALVAALLRRYVRQWNRILITVGIGAFVYGVLGSSTPLQGALSGIQTLLFVAGAGWLTVKVFRHDAVACLVTLFTVFMVGHGLNLISFSAFWYAAGGWIILVLGLVPIVLTLWLGCRSR